MYRNKCYRVVAHKSWHLLFSRTKKLFIHSSLWSSLAVIMSHWSRFKQAVKTHPHPPTPRLPASFKSVNHRCPLSSFWQISTSSSTACDILLSFFFWHGRDRRTRVPCYCNYIMVSLAAPWPLTQLFLWNIYFIVSFEIMRSLRHNKSSVEGWRSDFICTMHVFENT